MDRQRRQRTAARTPGVGKTYLSIALWREAILAGYGAERLGQQRAGPARKPLRGRLIQHTFKIRLAVTFGPRLVLRSFKAMIGIAVPPKADNPRLDSDFFGYRAGAAPVRRQQNEPRPLQIALQRPQAIDNTPMECPMANNRNPNVKQPGENPEGNYHFNPGNMAGKKPGILRKRPKTVASRMRTRRNPTVRTG